MTEVDTNEQAQRLERHREAKRRYYERNRDKVIERARQSTARDPERTKTRKRAWYLRNREQILKERSAYYARNHTKILERQRAYRERNRQRIRDSAWSKRHAGLSSQEWAEIWNAQQGLCYLCGNELTGADAYVDHDHACCPPKASCPACRRGLAHGFCNIAIGYAGDDPARLRRMADALEAAKAATAARMASQQDSAMLF